MTILEELPAPRPMPSARRRAAQLQLEDLVSARGRPWLRLSRATVLTIGIGLVITGSAAAGVLMSSGSDLPNPSVAVAAQQLRTSLLAQFPNQFAGITLSNDNATINIYVTSSSSQFESAVNVIAPSGSVNYVEVPNTWNSLLAVHEQLETALPSLQAQGIDISDFSTDPTSNTEVIDVVNLTAADTAVLDNEFGANDITVKGVTESRGVPVPLGATWNRK